MTLIKSISGIRGTIGGRIGEAFTPDDIVAFTAAFGNWLLSFKPEKRLVVIGRDARLSGDLVNRLVSSTLRAVGLDVADVGLSTTPTVEMAVVSEGAAGGIILTASHNPAEWNALKLLDHLGEFVSAQAIEAITKQAETHGYIYAHLDELGQYMVKNDAMEQHIDAILALPLVQTDAIAAKGFRIVVDGVNSTGGFAVRQLLEALGVDQVTLLHGEPTGRFAHNPEPLTEHLTDLITIVKQGEYSLGIAVDPDVDRLVLICENGEPFNEEYTLVAIPDYVLSHHKGSTVSNLSSTQALQDVAHKHGVDYYAAAVGEVNVVKKMKEVQAVIGGEGNGGIIYPELHYGRDALVGVGLILSALAERKLSLSELKAHFPRYSMIKQKIQSDKTIDVEHLKSKLAKTHAQALFDTNDGLKILFPGRRWVHLRASNTEPIVRIYAEAPTQQAAEEVVEEVKTFLIEP